MMLTQKKQKIIGEASEWCMLVESGEATDQEISQFLEWLSLSEEHQEEYEAICTLWRDGEGLAPLYQKDLQEIEQAGDEGASVVNLGEFTSRGLKNYGTKIWGSIAAVILLVFVAAILGGDTVRHWSQGETGIHYQTAQGETRRIKLVDGSFVHLNTQSHVEVLIDDEKRRIILRKGQAFFEVEKDFYRPFIVGSENTEVRALGTKFSVKNYYGEIGVLVSEGEVLVRQKIDDEALLSLNSKIYEVKLTVNESVIVENTLPIDESHIQTIEAEGKLSWRVGKLLFEKEPLAKVLREFNLYNELQITLGDQSLSALEISGYFDAHDPRAFVEAVQNITPIRIIEVNEHQLQLVRR